MLSDSLPDLDYRRLLTASRKLAPASEKPPLRMALLSDAATQQFVPVLRVILDRSGFCANIYEGPFDAIEIAAYDSSSWELALRTTAMARERSNRLVLRGEMAGGVPRVLQVGVRRRSARSSERLLGVCLACWGTRIIGFRDAS